MVTWPSRFAGSCQKILLSFVSGQLIWGLSTIRPRVAPGSPIALDVPQRFLQALLHRSRSKRPCLRSQGFEKAQIFAQHTTSPRENIYSQFTSDLGAGIHSFKPTNLMRSFFGPWPKIFSAWWLPFAAPMMRPPRLPSHEAVITKRAQ